MMRVSTSAIIGVVVHTTSGVTFTTTSSPQRSFHARGGGGGGGYFDPFPPASSSSTIDSSSYEGGSHRGGGGGRGSAGGWSSGGNNNSNTNNTTRYANNNSDHHSYGNNNGGGGWKREGGGGGGGGRGRNNTQHYEQPFHARRPQKAAEEEMFTAPPTSRHPAVSSPTPPPPGGIIVKKRRSTSDVAPPTPTPPAPSSSGATTPIVVKRRTRTDSPPPVVPPSTTTSSGTAATSSYSSSDAATYQDPPQAPPTPTSVLQTIKEILERGPKEGMPLPAVARKLPDVVLETMEEGLKAFVQNTPGADEIMELTTAGTNVGGFAPANSIGTVLLKLLLHPSEMSVSQASLAAKMAAHNSSMASLNAPMAPPAPRFSVTGIHGAVQPGNVQPVLPPVTSLKASASISLSPTSSASGAGSVPPPPPKGGAVPFIPPAPGAPAAARVLPVLDEEQDKYAADCYAAKLILDGTVSGLVVGLQKGGKLPYFISLEGLYTPSKPDPFLPLADNQRRGKPALDYRVGEGWRVVVDAIALESTSKLMRMTPGPHLPPMHAILKTWQSDILEDSGEGGGGVVRPARVLLRDNIVEKVLQDGAASVLDQYNVYALRSNSFPALTPQDTTEGCVEEYDLMRVARYVSVETVTPFTELLPSITPAITQHDLLHVLLSAPELYQLDSPHNPTGVRYLMDPRYLPSELVLTDEQRATCEIQCRQSAAEHRKGINRDKARAKYGLRRLKAVSHIRKYGLESFCDPYVLAYIVHDGMMGKGGGTYDISKLHEIDHSLTENSSSSSNSKSNSGLPVKRVVSVVSSENTSYTVPDGNRPGIYSQFGIPMNVFVKTTFPTADFFKKFIHLFNAEPNNFNYVATPKALVSGLEIGATVGGVAHSGGTSQPNDVPKPYSMVQAPGGLSSLNLDSSRGGGGARGGDGVSTRTSGMPTLQSSDPHLLPLDAMRTELHRLVAIMSAARRDYATPTPTPTTTKDANNTISTNPIAEGYVPVLVIFLRLRGSKLMRSCLISGETVLSIVEGDPSRFVMSGDGTAVKAIV